MSTETLQAQTAQAQTAHTETATPPRTRWAAIIWGFLFAAVAAIALWLLADDDQRSGIDDWTASLTPTTIGALAILAVGVLLLVSGAVGVIRRVQRRVSPDMQGRPAE